MDKQITFFEIKERMKNHPKGKLFLTVKETIDYLYILSEKDSINFLKNAKINFMGKKVNIRNV